MNDVPEELDKVVRVILAYRPKAKTKAAKKRKRLKVKLAKQNKPPE